MKTKPIKLRAFRIENPALTKDSLNILKMLGEKLDNTTANSRRMLLNQDDPKLEEDLISDYGYVEDNYFRGVMLRIAPTDEIPNIPDKLFDEEKISISDLDQIKIQNSSKLYKDHYYFLLNKEFLVTNLTLPTTITRLQTYINWLLEKERKGFLIEFTPETMPPPKLDMNSIKNIKIQDSASLRLQGENSNNLQNISFNKRLTNLTNDLLINLFSNTPDLKDIDMSKIISAELVLKIKKLTKKDDSEEMRKVLGAMLKPIGDLDNIIFTPKKGQPIKATDILKIKTVDIELTESNKISENQLFQEMESYIKELKNE